MFLLNLKAMAIYYNIYIRAGIIQVIQQKEKKYFKYLFFFWTYSLQSKTKPILHKLMILSATWYYLCHYKVLIPPKRITGVLLDLATWGLWTHIRILYLTKYFWKSANRLLPQKTNSFSLLSAVVYRSSVLAYSSSNLKIHPQYILVTWVDITYTQGHNIQIHLCMAK